MVWNREAGAGRLDLNRAFRGGLSRKLAET